jgi:hypothetical protein
VIGDGDPFDAPLFAFGGDFFLSLFRESEMLLQNGQVVLGEFFNVGIFTFVRFLLEFFYILLVVVDHSVDIFPINSSPLSFASLSKVALGFPSSAVGNLMPFFAAIFLSSSFVLE